MRPFHYTATVKVTTTDGSVFTETLKDHLLADNRDEAETYLHDVIKEVVYDWDCRKVDAPVERVEVVRAKLDR